MEDMRTLLDVVSLLSGAIVLLCLWMFFIMAQVTGIPTHMPKHGEQTVIPVSQMPHAIHQVHKLEACLAISFLVFIGSRILSRQLSWRDPNTVV